MLAHSLTVERLRSPGFWDELLSQQDGYGRWGRRKLAAYRRLVAEGEVGETVEEYAAGRELSGKTLGVVGTGNIGQLVVLRAKASKSP